MAIINKPSEHFETSLYTGTGSSLSISSLDFSPDLTWIKGRSGATEHVLTDSVRGVTKEISSNDDGAEETVAQGLTAFNSDGFTVGTDGSYNTSSATYASWNFKAGGSASTNEVGSIDSSVSVNTTSGFSIVTWTGNGTSGATLGHGLGVKPSMIISKNRDASDNWFCYHKTLGATKYIRLNITNAEGSATSIWNDTEPTTSVFSVGNDTAVNSSGVDYVAYCFADVQGYSKMGSYTGNGSTDGTFIYTGFKPAFIMVKRTDSTADWHIQDIKRDTYNPADTSLFANTTDVDTTSSGYNTDFLSNGFKLRGTTTARNGSGATYIYMAFAENPFVTSTGVPATAR